MSTLEPPARVKKPGGFALWLARMQMAHGRKLVIAMPYIWLILLFLLPFLIVFKISLAEMARAIPPYTDLWEWADGQLTLTLNLGNFLQLTDCPLYPASFEPVFSALKPFIARAGLTPYNVARRRGELKYLLLTESQIDGGMMLRFVLRSENKLEQLRAALPGLQEQLPQLKVITANIQPVHMAIMEGEKEIFFTEQHALAESFNGVPLWIRPQSFFQTNPTVASALYATARDWVRALQVHHMWDLFCGVGGFGLHCATPDMQLTGIEISAEAIACAKQSAAELGLTNLHFQALDSTRFATGQGNVPELVLVNPPRRGIGQALCDYLSQMAPEYIVYSSCNAQTMAKDIAHLPGYRIERVQLFDMFPHTAHYEVLTLLTKAQAR